MSSGAGSTPSAMYGVSYSGCPGIRSSYRFCSAPSASPTPRSPASSIHAARHDHVVEVAVTGDDRRVKSWSWSPASARRSRAAESSTTSSGACCAATTAARWSSLRASTHCAVRDTMRRPSTRTRASTRTQASSTSWMALRSAHQLPTSAVSNARIALDQRIIDRGVDAIELREPTAPRSPQRLHRRRVADDDHRARRRSAELGEQLRLAHHRVVDEAHARSLSRRRHHQAAHVGLERARDVRDRRAAEALLGLAIRHASLSCRAEPPSTFASAST